MTTFLEEPPQAGPARLGEPELLPVLRAGELDAFWEADDCRPEYMRLLTVQSQEACRQLASGVRLTGSVSHVADQDVAAYAWMGVQLERLGWELVGAPVWAWARVDFEDLVRRWPTGVVDDVVALVVDVPLGRTVLSAFEPWQELFDEGAEGTPSSRWARCLEIDAFPDSALQATLPFLELGDVVRACRLHDS